MHYCVVSCAGRRIGDKPVNHELLSTQILVLIEGNLMHGYLHERMLLDHSLHLGRQLALPVHIQRAVPEHGQQIPVNWPFLARPPVVGAARQTQDLIRERGDDLHPVALFRGKHLQYIVRAVGSSRLRGFG